MGSVWARVTVAVSPTSRPSAPRMILPSTGGSKTRDESAFGRGTGDDTLEATADLAGQCDGGDAFLHGALDLAGGGFALIQVGGDGGELVVGVGGRGAGEHGRAGCAGVTRSAKRRLGAVEWV